MQDASRVQPTASLAYLANPLLAVGWRSPTDSTLLLLPGTAIYLFQFNKGFILTMSQVRKVHRPVKQCQVDAPLTHRLATRDGHEREKPEIRY